MPKFKTINHLFYFCALGKGAIHSIIMNTLDDLLLMEMSRRNTDMVADLVFQKPELFHDLIEIFFRNEEPVSRRAAWVVDTVSEAMPELLSPYLNRIVTSLPSLHHDGLKRHSLRMLMRSPLPSEHMGELMNTCFDWLLSGKEAIAAKVYCMEILYRIALIEPDLKKELADSIEWRMEEESAGFRSKGERILKKLHKELH